MYFTAKWIHVFTSKVAKNKRFKQFFFRLFYFKCKKYKLYVAVNVNIVYYGVMTMCTCEVSNLCKCKKSKKRKCNNKKKTFVNSHKWFLIAKPFHVFVSFILLLLFFNTRNSCVTFECSYRKLLFASWWCA